MLMTGKEILTQQATQLVANLIDAKRRGEMLPPIYDKIATLGIRGQSAALELAKQETQKRSIAYGGYIIAAVILIVVIILKNK